MRGSIERGGLIAASLLMVGCWPLTGPKAPPSRRLAIEGSLACNVDESGVIDCWGPPERIPSALRELERVRALALANRIGCALLEDGSVWCWDPSDKTPQEVPGLADVRDLALAGHRGCAVLGPRGRVACWSMHFAGPGPAKLRAGIVDAVQVEVTTSHTCARITNGSVRCWMEDGRSFRINTRRAADFAIDHHPRGVVRSEWLVTTEGRVIKERYPAIERIDDAREIEVGGYGYCVLRATGQVACWSKRADFEPELAIDIEGIEHATEIAVGDDRACAREASGEVRCWGPGIEPTPSAVGEWQRTPFRIPGPSAIARVSVGDTHVCAQAHYDDYWCWGRHAAFSEHVHPQGWERVAAVHKYSPRLHPREVVAGDDVTWVLDHTGKRLTCEGWRVHLESSTCEDLHVPKDMLGIDFHDRWGCHWSTRQVSCFGAIGYADGFHELRDADRASLQPIEPTSFLGMIVDVAVGSAHACALLENGTVWCWGRNNAGQRGRPPTYGRPDPATLGAPTRVDGLLYLQAIDAGDLHTCGLGVHGEVWCWGANDQRQLGVEDPFANLVEVPGLPPLTSISVGARHGCGLDHEGTAWCWGLGRAAEQIPLAHPLVSIDAGGRSSCGIDQSGVVWCWGDNRHGQTNPTSPLGTEQAVPLPRERVRP